MSNATQAAAVQAIKTAFISSRIVAAMKANGGDIAKAFDSVMGAGSYAKLAGEVYHELRARQGL